MAINSVSASFSAVPQLQQTAAAKQPEAAERPPQEVGAANADNAREATAARSRSAQAESSSRSERPENQSPPKPVVNAQGQKTGTIINTTA